MGFRLTVAAFAVILTAAVVHGQRRDVFVESRNHPAIQYAASPTTDAVAALNDRLRSGAATLDFDPISGYLPAVLKALAVPVESQTLVFSQTSFQGPLINMHNPRAIYFGDSVSVGWVRGGALLEIAAQDPRQGVVFYALEQKADAAPQFKRDEQCLACHLSWETLGVPGLTVHSVFPLPDENSYVNGFTTIHGSPLEQRWGGWWVTGDHGGVRHMGNIPVMPADKGRSIRNPTQVLASVSGLFDLKSYPSPHSDVVALLVLEHQAHMTNLMTRIGWEARLAAASASADAESRVKEAAVDLVDYMLFIDEADLAGPVKGTSGFADVFTKGGRRDARGRSLRDLDLQRRLLRYPCSYMIYTEAFDALLPAAKDAIYARMWAVLSGRLTEPRYRRLTASDRRAVVEILSETKRDLPPFFTAAAIK
jgi:hypothetical protein